MSIHRYELVGRHNPVVTEIDPYSPLSVGNGEFAFTADITGMQTFPEIYAEGIPLCTQSQWGWHTQPANNEKGRYSLKDLRFEAVETNSKKVNYATTPHNQETAFRWLRENPHRLHLGRIGLKILKEDGGAAEAEDIHDICQSLDLWRGQIKSIFSINKKGVQTHTCCHPKEDIIAFSIKSDLFISDRLGIQLAFPYGTPDKTAADWDSDAQHRTRILSGGEKELILERVLDYDHYFVKLSCSTAMHLEQTGKHNFLIKPAFKTDRLELVCMFSTDMSDGILPSYSEIVRESELNWEHYWSHGGMIDFKGSTDKRAEELERRIVLSQYLMAIQCSGSIPPQETGLTFNSWYGKFHLEMHWWHGIHFVLWGRPARFEKSLRWYKKILPKARELAKSQGYRGVRWPKMVSYEGVDSPSPIGPLLIWQQPHPIYYAELIYRIHPNVKTLEAYREIVFETADFMASYAEYIEEQDRFVLGPGLIPAQENHRPETVLNPCFELEYWAFGLKTANEWRKRLHLNIVPEWEEIIEKLAPLPVKEGVYLSHENCPDTFTLFNADHPSMLGAMGMLPGDRVDSGVMFNTLKTVFSHWKMEKMWGWDFPLMAMTAARLGKPELAVEALLYHAPKNEYLLNGHNKQADRKDLPIYLPGNGGLLTAVAMMAAGWSGCRSSLPGFPDDGSWKVTWEDLHPML